MEIDFTPSQPAGPTPAGQVKARPQATVATDSSQLQGVAELQRKLNDLALTRPDKMAAASNALADVKYPPDELLNGIAHLLAIKLMQ
ncbi:MAG TPA: hypothetical protein VFE51_09715 [Verrucomicrobiae bacterium]|nr:hypothetical protein [Verrucomicrobiae bacterium]